MQLASRRAEQFAYSLLLFLILWLPIPLASNRPWAWSLMEMLIAIQSLALVLSYRRSVPWRKLRPGLWLIAAIALVQLLTLLQLLVIPLEWLANISPAAAEVWRVAPSQPLKAPLSVDPYQSHVALLKGCAYLLLVVNSYLLIASPDRVRGVMTAFVVSGTFQGFYGAMLVLSHVELSPVFGIRVDDIATGSFVYKNHFANYLILCLCMGLALVVADLNLQGASGWSQRFRRIVEALLSSKMLIRLCMIIMVIALVMSRSRMGNSAFFFTTIAGAVLALLLYRNRPRSLTVLFASVLLIDVVIVSSMFGLNKVRERIESTVFVEEGRVDVVNWALPMVEDFWLTGAGAGSFYTLFQNYAPEAMGRFYDHAHNDYLQFVIEYGVMPTLAMGAAVLYVLVSCLRTLLKRKDPLMKATALGCAMAIIAMLIHISVDFNLQAPANAASFLLILCLGMICSKMPRQGYERDAV